MSDKVKVKFINGNTAEIDAADLDRLRELGKKFTVIEPPPKPVVKKVKKGEGGDD